MPFAGFGFADVVGTDFVFRLDISQYAIKNPEAFGLRVGMFRMKRTDPQGLQWELIITMPPTILLTITGGLVRVITIDVGTRSKVGSILYLQKNSC